MTLLMSQFDGQLLRNLLEAAKTRSAAPQEVSVSDYDWKAPCRFTPGQVARLKDFAKELAGAISEVLGGLLRTPTILSALDVTQHYAPDLQAWQSQADAYCVALADGDRRCGLAALSRSSAAGWVGRLLGATSPGEQASRELTSVETAILLDILGGLTGAFREACQKAGGRKMSSASELLKAAEIEELIGRDPTKEYCKIALGTGEGQSQAVLNFVLTCDSLEGLAGAATGKAAPVSAEAIRKALIAHLEQAPVTVRIRLGQSRVTMGELMKLEAGDVLLLDKSVDQPAEVLVKDRLIMSGFPAACEGQYALQITSRAAAAKK